MKIGDMVQYVNQVGWEHDGLGVIVDTRPGYRDFSGQETGYVHLVVWLDEIHERGWDEAISKWAVWYDDDDFEKDIRIFVETS